MQDLVDVGRSEALADRRENGRQQDDREDKICRRPGRHDGGALRQALVVKGDRALGLGHRRQIGRGHRRRIGVAEHLDVAAQGHRAEFPTRSGAVVPAEELGAETNREYLDANAVPARHDVMAELVDEDEDGQDDKKPEHYIADAAGERTHE